MNRFEIPDDSGFLALVDPDAYAGLVPDWDFDRLLAHFNAAMAERSLLFWATGYGGMWAVDVVTDGSPAPAGFRRVSGPIRVTAGRLHLVNYESLSMVAQFPDVHLPEAYLADLVVEVPPGDYTCEIVQLADPEDGDDDGFVITVTPGAGPAPWTEAPWMDKAALGID